MYQWLAPLAGAAMGYLGSDGPSSQTTTSAPWGPLQQPILDAVIGQGTGLLNIPAPYYPGSTVAPVSSATTQGMVGAMGQARSPHLSQAASGALRGGLAGGQAGRGYLASSLKGGVTNPNSMAGNVPQVRGSNVSTGGMNERLGQMFDLGADKIQSRLSGQFAGGGRYGSGMHQFAQGDALGNFATNLYGQAYEADENRRLQAQMANQQDAYRSQAANQGAYLSSLGIGSNLYNADANRRLSAAGNLVGDQRSLMGMASGLDRANYLPYQQMMEVGAMDRGFNQQVIDADRARYEYTRNEPWDRVGRFLGMMPGGYGEQTSPLYNNRAAGALGGALSVMGIPGLYT